MTNVDRSVFSELYKDAYGFRPSGAVAAAFYGLSELDAQECLAVLQETVEDAITDDRRLAAYALTQFNATLIGFARNMQVTPGTALRWFFEAESSSSPDFNNIQNFEGFLYSQGLDFDDWGSFIDLWKESREVPGYYIQASDIVQTVEV